FYDGQPYRNAKDHLFHPITHPDGLAIKGNRINFATGERTPYDVWVEPYPHPLAGDQEVLTSGVLRPASYLIFGEESRLPEGSPLIGSGLQTGDQIVWADGERIFSIPQLLELLNDGRVYVLIERDGKTFSVRVPRVKVRELAMSPEFQDEVSDWQFEAKLKGRQRDLYLLAYNLTPDAVVEEAIPLIDREKQLDRPLEVGDRILAIDGTPLQQAYQALYQLQQRRVHVIVQRDPTPKPVVDWVDADRSFERGVDAKALQALASSIGQDQPRHRVDNLVLLNTVTPVTRRELIQSKEMQALEQAKQELAQMEDSDKKSQALQQVEEHEKQVVLGISGIQDQQVLFNPTPLELFERVYTEIWTTLEALFTGSLNPKWMSGPVGIVQVVQSQWM
ncbi:MAG: peptidase, partial [Chlamydiia bacterium]|nr:peptidase [Chlamydiia bacterium]